MADSATAALITPAATVDFTSLCLRYSGDFSRMFISSERQGLLALRVFLPSGSDDRSPSRLSGLRFLQSHSQNCQGAVQGDVMAITKRAKPGNCAVRLLDFGLEF